MTLPKSTQIDLKKFAGLFSKKRAGRPFREIASEIGEVSAPTLSRIEKGNVPDLDTFIRICRWLNSSPEDFIPDSVPSSPSQSFATPDVVCAHLRADRTLPPETAKALVTMIKLAYKDLANGSTECRRR